MGDNKTVQWWDEWTARMRETHDNGNGHGPSLAIEARRPTAGGSPWGDYAPRIHQWETILDRPAPPWTETGRRGTPVLSPPFVEWMQGLPPGWVTEIPGTTRPDQLRLLGNAVVPQQATLALDVLDALAETPPQRREDNP